jgi:serine/threonine protein kinase
VTQDELTPDKRNLVKEVRLLNFAVDLSQFPKTGDIRGQGQYGELHRARDPRTGREVVVKVLKRETMDESGLTYFRREAEVLASVDHETLLSLRGYVPLDSGKGGPAILTDYITGGLLQDLIRADQEGKSPSGWDAAQKLIVLYGIATGMKTLHSHRIMHRDLKPENVLLNDSLEPKVADFGLSKFVDPAKAMEQTSGRGTPLYMAPEINEGSDYTFPVDVYSYGVLTYATVTGRAPFGDMKNSHLIALLAQVLRGKRPIIPPDLDKTWQDLMAQSWSAEPTARPSFEEICQRLAGDEFVSKLDQAGAARFLAYQRRVSRQP